MKTSSEKNVSTFIHLSALSQYCIPFGNYILPIIIWSAKKNDSEFIDNNGKNVLNFQLSIFLYSIILAVIAIPIFIFTIAKSISLKEVLNHYQTFENCNFENFSGLATIIISAITIFAVMKIAEFILIIYAAIKSSNGEEYQYPLSIPFFK
jgi:uncharacterized protein